MGGGGSRQKKWPDLYGAYANFYGANIPPTADFELLKDILKTEMTRDAQSNAAIVCPPQTQRRNLEHIGDNN